MLGSHCNIREPGSGGGLHEEGPWWAGATHGVNFYPKYLLLEPTFGIPTHTDPNTLTSLPMAEC